MCPGPRPRPREGRMRGRSTSGSRSFRCALPCRDAAARCWRPGSSLCRDRPPPWEPRVRGERASFPFPQAASSTRSSMQLLLSTITIRQSIIRSALGHLGDPASSGRRGWGVPKGLPTAGRTGDAWDWSRRAPDDRPDRGCTGPVKPRCRYATHLVRKARAITGACIAGQPRNRHGSGPSARRLPLSERNWSGGGWFPI